MPVPVLLNSKKEVAVVIEDNGDGNFKPWVLRNTLTQQWSEVIAGNGPGRTSNKMEVAEMKVVVGDAHAAHFSGKTVPFRVPADKCGLWNSVCVLDNDEIIALTSTNAFGRNMEVWMVKGRMR